MFFDISSDGKKEKLDRAVEQWAISAWHDGGSKKFAHASALFAHASALPWNFYQPSTKGPSRFKQFFQDFFGGGPGESQCAKVTDSSLAEYLISHGFEGIPD